ncbi:MAG: hypothetical protein J6K41_09665 [Paraprevotella sp.]|nr:hypothetical protein [Paraprevotella sp.]
MKRLLLLFLGCIPMLASAQTLTEAQKQEALQCATNFCNLLVRYSNGERTLTTQINALCSGADCSAYDDIKTHKEITLRNYLMAIQQKYPKNLAMTITAPSLANSKTYVEPVMNMGVEWGNINGNGTSYAEMADLSIKDIENMFVVFDIIQKYPSLGTSINKKLIYDVKNKKITAFITTEGTYLSFLNGLLAFANKDYKAAVAHFDKGSQNDRSSYKNSCYYLAMCSSAYMLDFEKACYYAEKMNDPLFIAMIKLTIHLTKGQINDAFPYAKQLESLTESRTELNSMMKSNLYFMLANIYVVPQNPNQNINKALSYFKKAEELGDIKVGYQIFVYYTILGEDFIMPDAALAYLQKSAEKGYPPAFYHWGRVLDFGFEDKEKALYWYEKAAQVGNCIGMASAGKLLIEKGERTKGIEWLKKSLAGQNLEAQLEDCELTTGLAPWPKTRADVETLLYKYTGSSSSSNSGTQSTYTPPTNQSSSTSSNSSSHSYNSSSNYSSSSSYNHSSYRRHHKFNEAKDNYCVGLSAGYVQKQWVYDFDGAKEQVDVFGEDKFTHGFQFGIRIDPQFGYGFGINTGLYYEYYSDRSEDLYEEDIEYHYRSVEHSLYLPIHLKYSLNFSKWFQLAIYGGIGLDCGLKGEVYLRCDGETYDSMNLYDDDLDMKRFNASLEYGASMRIRRFQLDFTISKGLIDMSGSDEYTVKQNKLMSISASICF